MVTSTERARLWRLANPEKWKQHQKKYRDKNKAPPYIPEGKTARNKRYHRTAQSAFATYKLSIGCQRCGYNKCAGALDFHHLDPSTKERRVTAKMWKSGKGAIEKDKCMLVCKNCHMELHEDMKIKENGDVF